MILGLPAFGAWSMYQRVYYAYEDARSMVPIQVVMAAVVVVGALGSRLLLPPTHWVVGVGLAMSVSYVVGTGLAQWRLRRRLGARRRRPRPAGARAGHRSPRCVAAALGLRRCCWLLARTAVRQASSRRSSSARSSVP